MSVQYHKSNYYLVHNSLFKLSNTLVPPSPLFPAAPAVSLLQCTSFSPCIFLLFFLLLSLPWQCPLPAKVSSFSPAISSSWKTGLKAWVTRHPIRRPRPLSVTLRFSNVSHLKAWVTDTPSVVPDLSVSP